MYVLYSDKIASRRQIMNFIAALVEGFLGGGGLRARDTQKGGRRSPHHLGEVGPPPNQASFSLHRRLVASSMVATWPLGCAAASPPTLATVES
jgi:hypothetical protein